MNTMQQAVHIFKKDVRFLRIEIGVMVTVALIFAWTAFRAHLEFAIPDTAATDVVSRPMQSPQFSNLIILLVLAAAIFLTVRLIQSDPIPGTREFWLTRPYRWKSVLAAKVMFIVGCVNIPILLARIAIIVLDGFPLRPNLLGLVLSQLFMTLRVLVPVAALAAVTASLTPFIFAAVILMAAEVLIQVLIVRNPADSFSGSWPLLFNSIRASAEDLILISAGLSVVFIQYRYRKTALSRILGVGAIASVFLIYKWMPLSFAMGLQSKLWPESTSSSIQFAIGRPADKFIAAKDTYRVSLLLPVEMKDVPEGMAALPIQFSARIDGPGHRSIQQRTGNLELVLDTPELHTWTEEMDVPGEFLESQRGKVLMLHASVYLSLFKKVRTVSVPYEKNRWLDVPGGFRCFNGFLQHCEITTAFPAPLVTAFIHDKYFVWSRPWSYGPILTSMALNPVISSQNVLTANAEVTVWEAVGNLRREIEIQNFPLTDYVDIEQ